MSPCQATTGMPFFTPCREPLLIVIVEKRLSVSRAMTSAAMRSGGSVWAKSSCSLRAAFCRRSSRTSRVAWSISSRRARAAASSSRAARSWPMEPAVSPNQREESGEAFLEETRHGQADLLRLDDDGAVGDQQADQGHQNQRREGGAFPVPPEKALEQPRAWIQVFTLKYLEFFSLTRLSRNLPAPSATHRSGLSARIDRDPGFLGDELGETLQERPAAGHHDARAPRCPRPARAASGPGSS